MTPADRVREIVRLARAADAAETAFVAAMEGEGEDVADLIETFDEACAQLVAHILERETLAAIAPVGGPFLDDVRGRA